MGSGQFTRLRRACSEVKVSFTILLISSLSHTAVHTSMCGGLTVSSDNSGLDEGMGRAGVRILGWCWFPEDSWYSWTPTPIWRGCPDHVGFSSAQTTPTIRELLISTRQQFAQTTHLSPASFSPVSPCKQREPVASVT